MPADHPKRLAVRCPFSDGQIRVRRMLPYWSLPSERLECILRATGGELIEVTKIEVVKLHRRSIGNTAAVSIHYVYVEMPVAEPELGKTRQAMSSSAESSFVSPALSWPVETA